jgi:hypothetical protein
MLPLRISCSALSQGVATIAFSHCLVDPFDDLSVFLFHARAQYLFGTAIGDVSSLSPAQVFERAVRGIADVQAQYTVLPLAHALSSDSAGSGRGGAEAGRRGGIVGAAAVAAAEGEGFQTLSAMNMLDHGHLVNYGGNGARLLLVFPLVAVDCCFCTCVHCT